MTPEAALNSYRKQLERHGEIVSIDRMVPNVGFQAVATDVRARIMGYSPEEIAAGIEQGHRKAVILAEDVSALNPALKIGDYLSVRGVRMRINAIDDSTRRIGGTLLAYQCDVSGGS